MLIKPNNGPIDGKKINKLLKDIREGRSEYLESDINEALNKSNWRRFDPPIWIWFFCSGMSVFTFAIGTKNQFDVLLSFVLMVAPFISKMISGIGYKNYNKLNSIISKQVQTDTDASTQSSK